jgi:hypothetical protein
MQIEWLNFTQHYYGIHIQHAENGGEIVVPGTRLRADGYCDDPIAFYEFDGDYWHGNPKIFHKDDISPSTGKMYGELYQKTIEKHRIIKELGFKLITIWEYDWKRLINVVKKAQRVFRSHKN